jgi:hypothetical protein
LKGEGSEIGGRVVRVLDGCDVDGRKSLGLGRCGERPLVGGEELGGGE